MKKDATTSVSTPWPGEGAGFEDFREVLAAAATEAELRLEGDDSDTRLLSISGEAGGRLVTTWRREWDDAPTEENAE